MLPLRLLFCNVDFYRNLHCQILRMAGSNRNRGFEKHCSSARKRLLSSPKATGKSHVPILYTVGLRENSSLSPTQCQLELSRFALKIVILAVFLLLFYCEYFLYWTLPLSWPEQPDCLSLHCKKLMLVADPQIIGHEWRLFLLDILAIWDSDRYLKRSFEKAVNFLKPDIIIFLGDLIDQGHTATDSEFHSYVERLRNMFQLPESLIGTKVIVIPGDNDIGGIEDILVPANVQRFEKTFNQTEQCVLTELMEFCKVNVMTSVMQESKFTDSNMIRVALSHVPLMPKQSLFLKEVVKKIRPHLIFSGHFHTSSHYIAYENDVWAYRHSDITPDEKHFKHYKTYKFHEGFLHEIIVPTCSYRMGVYKMGFGAAFIDTKRQLAYYNVLWLPHRFKQIIIYTMLVLPVLIILLVKIWKKTRRFGQLHSRKANNLLTSFP